jgi:ferredoxin--NADP+ reductase
VDIDLEKIGMAELGTAERPLRVAIVGSGPSGFYAAEWLLHAKPVCKVDMFERLPTPYGLVRSGVAPDNIKIRNVTKVFEKTGRHERFNFFGNVEIGIALPLSALRRFYEVIIFACGTETNLRLGIPGEELPGCHTAASFVGWYNGHPVFRQFSFDLSQEAAVVIGVGNVAVDVARILCRTPDELKHTDITQNALDALAESRIREVHVIGRRGAAQAKFKENELRELGKLAEGEVIIDPAALDFNEESREEAADPAVARVVNVLHEFASQPRQGKKRRVYLHFLLSPVKVNGRKQVESLVLERNALRGLAFEQEARGTGEVLEMPCGLIFASIGYRGMHMPGTPFDSRRGIIPNHEGRVLDDGHPVPGLYAVGWIKRGPSGLIGTNKPDSAETVEKILEDLPHLKPCPNPSTEAMARCLAERGIRAVSFAEWHRIDEAEIERGKRVGKPRERFTRISHMLAVLDQKEEQIP